MKIPARRPPLALALAISLSAASLATAQGPGGPGGRGGWGGPGGGPGGGSLLGLAQMAPVQEELKVTPDQVEKLKKLNDLVGKKQQDLRAAFRPNNGGRGQNGGNGNGGQANNPGGNGGAQGQNNAGQNNNGGRGGRGNRAANDAGQAQPATPGQDNGGQQAGGGQQANGGGQGQPGGGFGPGGGGGFGPGGRGNNNMTEEERAAMQERFAAMQAAQATLTKDTEAALAKILDKKQQTRLAQIRLQRQGLQAFVSPELTGKLNIDEDRVAQIREILDGQNQARRAQFAKMGEVFAQFTNGNGRPSREEMQALQENPEFQKKMDAQRKEADEANKTFEATAKQQIGRLLSKKQKDAYAKLIGAPFDLTKLNNGRGGPNRGNNPNTTAGGTNPPAAGAATTPPPATTTPGQPARKSLRDRRGNAAP